MNETEILLDTLNSSNSLTVTTILSVVFLGVLLITKFYQIKEFSSCNKKNISVDNLTELTNKLIENTEAIIALNNILRDNDEIKITTLKQD